jgi:hypothetical protein
MIMVDVNLMPALDFEAGMTGSTTEESVTGVMCVLVDVGIVIGIITNTAEG